MVKRNWLMTFVWFGVAGLFGIAAIGFLGLYWVSDGWQEWAGCVLGLPSLLLSFVGLLISFASTKAVCPECGGKLPDPEQIWRCSTCDCFGEVVENSRGQEIVRAIENDRVAQRPVFFTSLPEQFAFLDECVVCGAPPEQEIEISYVHSSTGTNLLMSAAGVAMAGTVGVGFTQTGGGTRYSVNVPHCHQHQNGAKLGHLPTGIQIYFSSLPYLHRFERLNATR